MNENTPVRTVSSPVQLSSAGLFWEPDTDPTSFKHRCRHPFFLSECCCQVIKKRSSNYAEMDGVWCTSADYAMCLSAFFFSFSCVSRSTSPRQKRYLPLQAKDGKDRKAGGAGSVSHNGLTDESCTGLFAVCMLVFSFISPLCSIIRHLSTRWSMLVRSG